MQGEAGSFGRRSCQRQRHSDGEVQVPGLWHQPQPDSRQGLNRISRGQRTHHHRGQPISCSRSFLGALLVGTPLDNTQAKWTTRSPVELTTCARRKSHTDVMPLETPLTAKLRYPKLRQQTPVLHRSADEVQVGIDSDTALIFSEPKLISVLLAMDGAHHLHDILDAGAAAGLRADEVEEVVRILADANMLLEAGSPVGPPDGVRGGRSERLRARLTSEFQIQVATVNHWTRPSSAEVDLTVIVSDAAEADRLVTEDLVRADQPHLIVRSAGDLATVGPLVIPGRTACLRCTDLTRRDADRAWPALLDQLTRLRLPAPPALSAWAACMTVTQALAFLRGGTPEAGGSTLELSQHDLVTRRRTWAMHPNCDCHWLSAGQWSA